MPSVARGRLREASGAHRAPVEDHERTPREDVPDHRDVAVALDPGADDRDPGGTLGPRCRRDCRIATPETAAVRRAVIGPAIDDRDGQSGPSVVEDDRRVDRRQPERPVRPEPGTHFMPRRSSAPSASAPRR